MDLGRLLLVTSSIMAPGKRLWSSGLFVHGMDPAIVGPDVR